MNSRENRERKYNSWPSVLLALMMILTGAILTSLRLFGIEYGESTFFVEDDTFGIVGRAMLIVGGLIIILMRKRGNYFSVGIYALTLGLSRVIRSLPGLVAESNFTFYTSLVFVVIGGNLAWGGYNHLTVKTRNPATMRFTAWALLSIYGLFLGYAAYIGEDAIGMFLEEINLMGYLPLYVGLLIVLYSRELMENIPLARVSRYLKDFSSNVFVGEYIKISEEDAKRIEEGFSDACPWEEIDVGEYRIKESAVTLHTHNGEKDVVLERWPGSDRLYFNVVNDRTDSFIGGQRVRVTGYEISGNIMNLYDASGVCAIMRIGGIGDE